jgi:hypothetical protein
VHNYINRALAELEAEPVRGPKATPLAR